jgi:hypothetical protein
MTCGSALLGLDRYLLTQRAPLREIVENGLMVARKREEKEGEIGSRILPHGSVEADIHVGKASLLNADLAQSWACLTFVHREIMPSHEERFEASTSFAGQINLAQRAWIGMRDYSYSVRMASRSVFLSPLRVDRNEARSICGYQPVARAIRPKSRASATSGPSSYGLVFYRISSFKVPPCAYRNCDIGAAVIVPCLRGSFFV